MEILLLLLFLWGLISVLNYFIKKVNKIVQRKAESMGIEVEHPRDVEWKQNVSEYQHKSDQLSRKFAADIEAIKAKNGGSLFVKVGEKDPSNTTKYSDKEIDLMKQYLVQQLESHAEITNADEDWYASVIPLTWPAPKIVEEINYIFSDEGEMRQTVLN